MSYSNSKTTRKTIVLQLTENCNLHCIYCYQHSKHHSEIGETLLKQIIFDAFAGNNDFKELEFDFIGGEPLLCMPLIKRVCEWTWSEPRAKDYIFFATTNGVAISDEDKEWFRLNKDRIWLGLSLDGTREMQNKNRCNSFDSIDIDFFLNTWPEQGIKMTVSPITLETFAEGAIYLHEKGFKLSANLAYGVDWSDERHQTNLERELRKLIDYYLDNENVEPIMLLNLPLFKLNDMPKEPERWCGAGKGMEAFDIQGNRFPCQMFYSTTGTSIDGWENVDISEIYLMYYEHCKMKQLFNICPLCVGMAYSCSGDQFECDPNLCKLMQVFFRANAYFQSQKITKNRTADFAEHSAKSIVKGIQIINHVLN